MVERTPSQPGKSPRGALPSLNGLLAFEVSGRRLSFRAAADELDVTQGAVAQQVRALERQVGFCLFHRHARGLTLTEVGAIYWKEVSKAFVILRNATSQVEKH